MHKRNALIFCVLTLLSTWSCTCKKVGGLEPTTVSVDAPVDASAPSGTADSLPVTGSGQSSPAVAKPSSCPSGMKEVSGDYCMTVEHRCLKGRDVIFTPPPPGSNTKLYTQTTVAWSCNNPDGCAVPYYCDKFVEGYAVCGPETKPLHFCIDEYEYPNVVGQKPTVMVSWYEAKKACTDAGKRLCDDDEWGLACEGPEHVPYSYGWERDPTACNIDKPQRDPGVNSKALGSKDASIRDAEVARLDQREPIGSSPRCVSPYGVHDMTGNVDEWANNVTRGGKPFHSIFAGGHWVGGARNRCRPRTDSHNEDFAFYAEGFRCCSNPQGAKR